MIKMNKSICKTDANGTKRWYLDDKQIDCKSQEEFERLMRLKAFW